MPKSVNKVSLLGNLGKDPEVKFLPSGQAVANFSIATTDRVKSKDADEWKDRTEWHNVAAYGRTAEIVRDYVKKGNKIFIEGRLTTRSWDDKDTGKKVYRTEIVVNDLVLLGARSDGQERTASETRGSSPRPSSSGGNGRTAFDDYPDMEITDDDIPF